MTRDADAHESDQHQPLAAPLRVWPLAFAGALLLWLIQPPLGLSWLAWLSLVPWSLLVAKREGWRRGGWRTIWLAAFAYWLLTLQGIRHGHPALYAGWIVLAAYLAVYPLLFVALARKIHHRWRWPLVLAVPTVWSGLECVRSYAFTGISIAMLGHSQVNHSWLVQIADVGGSYWVSFVIASINAVIAVALQRRLPSGITGTPASTTELPRKAPIAQTVWALALVALTIGYGYWRTRDTPATAPAKPLLSALMIQRNEHTEYVLSESREREIFSGYVDTSLEALGEFPEADLVIWPESMFTGNLPYRLVDEDVQVPPEIGLTAAEFTYNVERVRDQFLQRNIWLQGLFSAATNGPPPQLLVGCSVVRYAARPHAHCGALLIDAEGNVAQWYAKQHLVMIGEYLPFGDWLPWLYEIGPMSMGVTPGEGPVAMRVGEATIAPNICFETAVEQVTGNNLRRLAKQGQQVDLVVTVTNDGWFQGASLLDHHQRSSQMTALINRVPLLIVANQGPTAWIDGDGQVQQALPHRTDGYLLAKPVGDDRWSVYQRLGDWLSWPFVLVCLLAVLPFGKQRRGRN